MRYRYIHILAAFFLILGMGVQFFMSYYRARYYAKEIVDMKMEIAEGKLRFALHDAYDAVDQMKVIVEENLSQPEKLYDETRTLLIRYPNFYSSYVSFPEYYYPNEGKWFSPCSFRVQDSIYTVKFGDEYHDYFTREWYKGALQSGEKGFWSQPYVDEDFDETIFTHSDNMVDKDGKLICVIAMDFSVSWMQEQLEEFKPDKEAIGVLYSSNGKLLTASKNLGENDPSRLAEEGWVVSRHTLNPLDIDIVVAVPRWLIWKRVLLGIMLPFIIFVLGIVIVGVLIRRMLRDQTEKVLLESEKEMIKRELNIAHDIQMGILRHDFPNDKGITVNSVLLPMLEVGGDLYDFSRNGDYLCFIVGDVSGKGVSAAMFMSATVNLFRSTLGTLSSPKAIMMKMNGVLSDNNPSLTFVTAFVGRLQISTGQLLYCNAAHLPPLVVSPNGDVKVMEMTPNIPLGYDAEYEFVEEGFTLGKDEKLVLCTDGVTEAVDASGKMMGEDVWRDIVAENGDLLEAVKHYIGAAEQVDDITIMSIHRMSEEQNETE